MYLINCWMHVHVASYYLYLSILLQLSGDVETNPGPIHRNCPECSKLVSIRKAVCDCGYNLRKKLSNT